MNTFQRLNRLAAAIALSLTFSTVTPAWAAYTDTSASSFAEMVAKVALVPPGTQDSEMLTKVTVAVGYIKRMELEKAQHAINEALQLDPRNAHLHFLNGFVYHLQALQGDTQKGELALEGYQQSLRIDPSNWIAQEFLGLAYMDLKRVDQAKLAFADALLLTPQSAQSINGLMVSSYLTGDAKTACAMADQFLKVTEKPSVGFMQSSISVYGSCGSFARADWVRDALVRQYGDLPEMERIDRRLAQWKSFYAEQQANSNRQSSRLSPSESNGRPIVLAQAFTLPELPKSRPGQAGQPNDYSSARPAAPPAPDNQTAWTAEDNEPAQSMADKGAVVGDEPSAAPARPAGQGDNHPDSDKGPPMLLVDVVLLSTQELMSTAKGVNLLNALTLQLGSTTGNLSAYSRVNSSNVVGGTTASSTSITRAVTVPALSYSMNIANANNSVNEVLARPTLAAIEGMPSEFFSGTNLSAGVVSTSQQGGTTIVPLEKRFGIKLAVTPNFLPEGRVQLKVEAQRTALNASSDNPRVAYQIEIGETTANANVVMNLGDTLVLSGLSEKSSSSTRDGVPGLQDVPVVQYLFSNKRTNELQRSVLILVTPRAPMVITQAADESDNTAIRMQQLREKFDFSDHTPANIEAVMAQLQSNTHYREFRQGDVSLERWDRMRSTGDRLKEALGFLYY